MAGMSGRELLRSFLEEHLSPASVADLLAELEPMFLRARTQKHELEPAMNGLETEMLEALRQLFGHVQAIVLVSQSNHPRFEQVMEEEACLNDFWAGLLKAGWWSMLETNLAQSIRNDLRATLRIVFWQFYLLKFDDTLANNIFDVLFHFLGFVIAGKTQEAEKFRPFVRFLPYAVPLGQKKINPGVWLVLAA